MSNSWHDKLHDLKALAAKQGLRVVYCTDKYSKDYIGMNPRAAKVMGFPSDKKTIYIDRQLSEQDKYHVLRHELSEYKNMGKGMSYYKSHCVALENE